MGGSVYGGDVQLSIPTIRLPPARMDEHAPPPTGFPSRNRHSWPEPLTWGMGWGCWAKGTRAVESASGSALMPSTGATRTRNCEQGHSRDGVSTRFCNILWLKQSVASPPLCCSTMLRQRFSTLAMSLRTGREYLGFSVFCLGARLVLVHFIKTIFIQVLHTLLECCI